MSQTHNIPNKRLYELDFLRGLAVLLVLGRHIIILPNNIPLAFKMVLDLWIRVGWVGVDLFFVLSGFLVSGLLFNEYKSSNSVAIGRFLLRRAFKIYPIFYLMIFFTILIEPYLGSFITVNSKTLLGEILFIQNYYYSIWNHTWSLAVEEHFYLLISLIFLLLTRFKLNLLKSFHLIRTTTIILFLAIITFRVAISFNNQIGQWKSIISLTHFRIDSLLAGVVLSYFYNFFPEQLRIFVTSYKKYLFAVFLLAITPLFIFTLNDSRFIYSFGFSLFYLGFSALLLLVLFSTSKNWSKNFVVNSIQFIGKKSYSIYLFHMPVYFLTVYFVLGVNLPMLKAGNVSINNGDFYLQLTAYLFVSILVGILSTNFIELPFLKIRDKYFPAYFKKD